MNVPAFHFQGPNPTGLYFPGSAPGPQFGHVNNYNGHFYNGGWPNNGGGCAIPFDFEAGEDPSSVFDLYMGNRSSYNNLSRHCVSDASLSNPQQRIRFSQNFIIIITFINSSIPQNVSTSQTSVANTHFRSYCEALADLRIIIVNVVK